MRYLLIILLFLSFSTNARPLCAVNDEIAEDLRIDESEFNQKNAEIALEYLSEIVKSSDVSFQWSRMLNATKLIQGYALKRKALLPGASRFSIEQFCRFYHNEGWYHD